MANALQLRRGTTTQHSTFTGLAGEVTVDTTKDTVVVHDGATAGGIPLATESYVGTEVANLVDSAPSTLDTLNELAAALGDDPNFATTVTNSIATKMPLSGGIFTGNVTITSAQFLVNNNDNSQTFFNYGPNQNYIRGDHTTFNTTVSHANDVTYLDNVKAKFGTGSDLQIYHDGSNSYISDAGTGTLSLQTDGSAIQLATNTGEVMAYFAKDGEAQLFHNNVLKAKATATGFDINGSLTGLDIMSMSASSGYAQIEMGGPSGAYIDMKSPVSDDYDGRIQYDGSTFKLTTNSDQPIVLQHNNSSRLTTSTAGVDITGTLTTDGVTVDGTLDIEQVLEKVTTNTTTSGLFEAPIGSGAVYYLTNNQTANRTINFSSANLLLGIGQSYTATVLATQGSTAYYFNAYQVDGSAVTPKWSGGSAPTGGNASGIDVYTFTIIKTANATFTVLASVTQYA